MRIRGRDQQYKLVGKDLAKFTAVKDLGIHVASGVSWKQHIEERMKKAKKFCTCLSELLQLKQNTFVKLALYNSLILPVWLYGFTCLTAGRTEIKILEKFQKS